MTRRNQPQPEEEEGRREREAGREQSVFAQILSKNAQVRLVCIQVKWYLDGTSFFRFFLSIPPLCFQCHENIPHPPNSTKSPSLGLHTHRITHRHRHHRCACGDIAASGRTRARLGARRAMHIEHETDRASCALIHKRQQGTGSPGILQTTASRLDLSGSLHR